MPAAIPSSSVDLPLPFSPTRKVTADGKATVSRDRTTCKVNGYASSSHACSISRTDVRNFMSTLSDILFSAKSTLDVLSETNPA